MMKMTEEIIMLMERLLEFHELYESYYETYKSRFNLEVTYWFNLKQLNILIEDEFKKIKPFDTKKF